MPRARCDFRLPRPTVDKLDEIARRMPRRPGGMPATRTDAVIVAVDKLHETTNNTAERREGE